MQLGKCCLLSNQKTSTKVKGWDKRAVVQLSDFQRLFHPCKCNLLMQITHSLCSKHLLCVVSLVDSACTWRMPQKLSLLMILLVLFCCSEDCDTTISSTTYIPVSLRRQNTESLLNVHILVFRLTKLWKQIIDFQIEIWIFSLRKKYFVRFLKINWLHLQKGRDKSKGVCHLKIRIMSWVQQSGEC